jgi:hypothetical protein
MNVGMTRARRKLLLVGDSSTLCRHPFFVELLAYVKGVGDTAPRVRWANMFEYVRAMAAGRACVSVLEGLDFLHDKETDSKYVFTQLCKDGQKTIPRWRKSAVHLTGQLIKDMCLSTEPRRTSHPSAGPPKTRIAR